MTDLPHDSDPLSAARGLSNAVPLALLLWAFILSALFVFGVL